MRFCIGYSVLLALTPLPVLADDIVLTPVEADSQLTQIELAISAGRLTQAGSMLQSLETRLPDEFASRHGLLTAELHMASGDVAAAKKAMAKLPTDISDTCRYGGVAGWLSYQTGDWNGAIAMLAKSVQACPGDAGRWNLLGLALVRKEEIPAALEAFDQALVAAPDHPALLNNRALAYAYSGKSGAAIGDLERAASIAGDDNSILSNLAILRANAGLDAPLADAQDSQTQSMILAKAGEGASAADRHAAARSYYAEALLRSERFDQTLWTKATTRSPDNSYEDENITP